MNKVIIEIVTILLIKGEWTVFTQCAFNKWVDARPPGASNNAAVSTKCTSQNID